MKRLAALVAVLALAAFAAVAPRPDPPVPLPERIVEAPTTASGFAACSRAVADSRRDTLLSLITEPETPFRVSFPIDGDVVEEIEDELEAQSGVSLRIGQTLAQGLAPAIAEFAVTAASAGVVTFADNSLSASSCPSAIPKIWHLPGGSTLDGQRLQLHILNPFPDDATVRILAHSDLGVEAGLEDRIRVAARSSVVIDLTPALPQREFVAITVESELGDVVASMSQLIDGGDEAQWPGVGQSEVWEFPLISAGGLDPVIRVSNDTPISLEYELDVFAQGNALIGAESGTVGPLTQVEISLASYGPGIGARVVADGPVSAAIVGRGEAAWAVAPGVPGSSVRWMAPGLGSLEGGRARLWILNSADRSVTLTYSALDSSGFPDAPGKVTVPALSARGVPLDVAGAGLLIESPEPVSIAWSLERGDDVAYTSGVAIPP